MAGSDLGQRKGWHLPRCRDRCRRNQRGATLAMVLILMTIGLILVVAALAFVLTGFRAGSTYEKRGQKIAAERDAMSYLVQTIRPDLAKGIQGDTRTATVAGVTATCQGESGSGVTQGAGRTDRVIECSTPSITARYRIFDRSGDQPGIIVETLSTTTS